MLEVPCITNSTAESILEWKLDSRLNVATQGLGNINRVYLKHLLFTVE